MTPTQTKLLEDLRSGAWRLAPGEATPDMYIAGGSAWCDAERRCKQEQEETGIEFTAAAPACACYAAMLAASPDHTPALFALIEERDRVIQEGGKAITELVTRAEAAEADRDALRALICRIGPHIDAIVCYASTMGEHEPNRIAHEVRAVCSGPSQDEVVGQKIAAQMIAKIDAAVARSGAGHGWLIELKGGVPSWAVVNPEDYDEHWTTDSTRALRFARREDAQSYIDHIGWTEAFPSEHIWDDGERHDQ